MWLHNSPHSAAAPHGLSAACVCACARAFGFSAWREITWWEFFLLPKNRRWALIWEWTIDFSRPAASTAEKKILFSQGICSLIHFHSSRRYAKWALKQRETAIELLSREGILNTGGMNGGSGVVSRASGRGGRPLSRCKLPSHLHVKPIGQTIPNGMFGIKVSHIRSGWKWMKVRQSWGEGERKCDWLGWSASCSGTSKKKAALITLGVFVTACSRQWSCRYAGCVQKWISWFQKGPGCNRWACWRRSDETKWHRVNCFFPEISETLRAKRCYFNFLRMLEICGNDVLLSGPSCSP